MDFEGELQVLTPLDLASDTDFSFFLVFFGSWNSSQAVV